jgi:phosphoglycerol transferase MdoB-like AlkP superfamily enzyme
MLAAIRPDDWNLPLLVHVLGAVVLVGALVTVLAVQSLGWRRQEPAAATSYARLAFRTLLLVALPAWFVMRIGAEWIYSKEGFGEGEEPAWLGIGYITADLGGLLLLVSIILSGLGVRRLRRGEGERSVLARIATVLVALALLAYVVAVWAMSAKPD